MNVFELVISSADGVSSGSVYTTILEPMDAVDAVATNDGLTARYGHSCLSGFLIDLGGKARFQFRIKPKPRFVVTVNHPDGRNETTVFDDLLAAEAFARTQPGWCAVEGVLE
jgi:hypothetical protein